MSPTGSEFPEKLGVGQTVESRIFRSLTCALAFANRLILFFACLALLAAAVILSSSVAGRIAFRANTYWQDEASVLLLVGATFMTAAHVQSRRGHIAIEALAHMLPAGINRVRQLLADGLSLVFCAFFSWKSYLLFHEAWADGQVTTSTWAPPLWIPYGVMTIGMALLSLQILLQMVDAIGRKPKP